LSCLFELEGQFDFMTHVHLIGIGGTGLSAIALVLLESGYTVSGSDRQLSPLALRVQARGAQVFAGHRAENVQGADLVVRSSAIPDDNVEVQAALGSGIPVLKRADFLGELMSQKPGSLGIAVAGTHGKTTTTAMIAWMLTSLGHDPSYIIGGVSANLGSNAHAGSGAFFVIEADEYDRMFLGLRPQIAVVTNVEHDHPDCYPTPADFQQAFLDFAARLPADGTLLACSDDPGAARLLEQAAAKGTRCLAYASERAEAAYRARDLKPGNSGGYSFEALCQAGEAPKAVRVALQVPGAHNVQNALATLAVADQLGLPLQAAAQALGTFRGTGRRFELRGEAAGVALVDDYAHHPTEIRATLAAARSRYAGRRIWAVWQPHTYSRTRTLLPEFLGAFADADRVLVTPVYAARETAPQDGFSAVQVAAAIESPAALYVPGLEAARDFLLAHLQPADVVLVLSAGDADQLNGWLLEALQAQEAQAAEHAAHSA
jgi:UDP-N-acetylmuramate--alanine ligase